MNDLFDVLNGRHPKVAITVQNWYDLKVGADGNQGKKRILDSMLAVLGETERAFERDSTKKMFCLKTTIHAWRLSIRSAMALIKEQLNAAFAYALTGKWNQDPLEVGL